MIRPQQALQAFAWAFAIGVVGGVIGLGGAEFRLPVLVGWLGLAVKAAVPVNLAVSLVTLLAALPARLGAIPMEGAWIHAREVLGMALGASAAAFYGAGILSRISTLTLQRVILILLVVLGLVLIADAFLSEGRVALAGGSPILRFVSAAMLGIGIGLVSSLLGVAGGELIIPSLVLVFGVGIKLAGTLGILVSLPTIVVGLARYYHSGALGAQAQLQTIATMAPGAVIGAVLGGLLAGVVPAQVLKVGLGLVLIWSAFRVFAHSGSSRRA